MSGKLATAVGTRTTIYDLEKAMKHGFRRLARVKPPLQRRARQIIELADALQAKPLEQPRDVVGKSQGLAKKIEVQLLTTDQTLQLFDPRLRPGQLGDGSR